MKEYGEAPVWAYRMTKLQLITAYKVLRNHWLVTILAIGALIINTKGLGLMYFLGWLSMTVVVIMDEVESIE